MTTNVGGIDRILRIAIGAALLLWFFIDQGTGFSALGQADWRCAAADRAVFHLPALFDHRDEHLPAQRLT